MLGMSLAIYKEGKKSMSLGNFHSETKESNLNKNDKNVL